MMIAPRADTPAGRPAEPQAAAAQWRVWVRRLLWLAVCLTLAPLPAQADTQYWIYTVRPGDNIWNLTKRYCTSVHYWQLIQSINRIRLDRQIPPGSKLRFPMHTLKYQPATARVAELRGSARLVRAGSTQPEPLSAGTELRSGDRVITEGGANVTLQFADGSELLVLGESEVLMDTLSAWGTTGMVDTRVRLQGGRVDSRARPARGPGSRYQIITPAAVAAVRGTRFRVASDPEPAVTRSEVTEGTVGVGDARAVQDVPAGFGLVAEAGQPPQAPRELLPPPRIREQTALQRQLPLRFAWTPLAEAQAYRLQIAPDSDFRTLLVDLLSEQAQAEWPDLPDGRYALRVRGIDEVGLEGLDAVQAFEVDARPLAPVASGLTGGMVTRTALPRLSWKAQDDSTRFRLQLARDTAFEDILVQTTLEGEHFDVPDALSPGRYHWRVAGIASDGGEGPFSLPAEFNYRPLPAAPAPLTAAQISKRALSFQWQPVAGATRYRFQFAEDAEFKQRKVDLIVSEPSVEIRRPGPEFYYARVRAENAAGEAGPFTPPLQVEVPPPHYWGLLILLVPLLLAL